MRDILADIDRWLAEGKKLCLATVIQTWGSSPRRAGAKMVVASDGQFSGSVSGGCVENAVIETALESIETGRPKFLHFGVADETAWEVGLACGGSIDIFAQPLDEEFFPSLRKIWMEDTPAVHVTVIRGDELILGREMLIREDGSIVGIQDINHHPQILELASDVFSHGKSQRATLEDGTELFLELISPSPTLIVVGGVHITKTLMSMAKMLGFRTVVIDPRSVWGNEGRFSSVDQLINAWIPDAFQLVKITPATAVVMLTHDPKLDDPATKIALDSSAFYVGALGSKTTNAKRRERLLKEGVDEEQLTRLHAPIGLVIGAETPEEIALAIMSEIVEVYRKREQPKIRHQPHAVGTNQR
jgi:xanthine dehydrogenase accessory factor